MTIKFKDQKKALPAKEEPKPEEKPKFGTRAPNGTFDRKAYMREYMQARRKKS